MMTTSIEKPVAITYRQRLLMYVAKSSERCCNYRNTLLFRLYWRQLGLRAPQKPNVNFCCLCKQVQTNSKVRKGP